MKIDIGEVRNFTFEIDDDGMLFSILVEVEGTFRRCLYKRNPAGMELALTDNIFEEAVNAIFDNGIVETEELYREISGTDEYYANLMRKAYKKYLKTTVLNTSIHQDTFWN